MGKTQLLTSRRKGNPSHTVGTWGLQSGSLQAQSGLSQGEGAEHSRLQAPAQEGSGSPCCSLAPVRPRPATWCVPVQSPGGRAQMQGSPTTAGAGLCVASSRFSQSCSAGRPPQEGAHGDAAGKPAGAGSSLAEASLTADSEDRARCGGLVEHWGQPHSLCGKRPCRARTGSSGQRGPAGTGRPSSLHLGQVTAASPHWFVSATVGLPSPLGAPPRGPPSAKTPTPEGTVTDSAASWAQSTHSTLRPWLC